MSRTGRLTLNLAAETASSAADWRQGALDLSQAHRDAARSRASADIAPGDGIRLTAQAQAQAQHQAKASA